MSKLFKKLREKSEQEKATEKAILDAYAWYEYYIDHEETQKATEMAKQIAMLYRLKGEKSKNNKDWAKIILTSVVPVSSFVGYIAYEQAGNVLPNKLPQFLPKFNKNDMNESK